MKQIISVVFFLKIGSYNQFENPTGIYFELGDDITIVAGDTQKEAVAWDDTRTLVCGTRQAFLKIKLKLKDDGI